MLEAREVPQLVRGDRDRQGDEVGARGRRLAGLAQQVGDVDRGRVRGRDLEARGGQDRRARDIQVAPVDPDDKPPSRPVKRRVVEVRSSCTGPTPVASG